MASPFVILSVIGVVAYYVFAWMLVGRDPRPGHIMPLYSPPRELSPAMMRYVWKEVFDDRAVWSSLLNLVAQGLATMQPENGVAVLRVGHKHATEKRLPPEEQLFFDQLLGCPKKKGMPINMLEGRTGVLVGKMAEILRREAVGKWFNENRKYTHVGTVLSGLALCVAAMPSRADEWLVLVASLAMMAPGTFYLLLLALRLRDLYRASQMKFDVSVMGRTALLLVFLACCIASILMGSLILGSAFGWPVAAVAGFFAILDLSFLHLMRAPTAEGRQLLDEIQGFRIFLNSVEQPTMDRLDGPSQPDGVYEKYLPYAVALEVEQAWGDRFVALASSYHGPESIPGAQSLYLGLWNGKPVEVAYYPQATRR